MRSLQVVLFMWAVLTSPLRANEGEEADDQDIGEESLSAEQLRRLHQLFDENGDGKVSMNEVMDFAHKIGKTIASKDIGSILEEIDTSKDGHLSLEEHITDIQNQADGGDEEEMKELQRRYEVETAKFKAADANGDGLLDKSELPSLFYPETHDAVLGVTVGETLSQKDANSDGVLTPHEFWEASSEGEEAELSEEEQADFAKLDTNHDGVLNHEELMAWESGKFHTHEALMKLFEIADKDSDMHVTADELAEAKEHIAESDVQYHLIEWAEHHEL